MWKRIFGCLLVLTLLLVPVLAARPDQVWKPDPGSPLELLYQVENDGTVTLTGGTLALAPGETAVHLPETIDGKPVRSIDYGAFQDASLSAPLYLPDSLVVIEESAFASSQITELHMGAHLERIGEYAFFDCTGLTGDLVFPDGLTEIGSWCFSRCTGLSGSLKLPANLRILNSFTFSECTNLTGPVIFPAALTSVGNSCFEDCSSLTGELQLPAGLETLGESVFSGCTQLTGSILFPAGLKTIGSSCFYGCSGLTGELQLPAGLESLGSGAFAGCSSLTGTLVVPDGLTEIKGNTFQGCRGLTGLQLPQGLLTIERQAFDFCSGLTGELQLPQGLRSIGNHAFRSCEGLTGKLVLPDGLTEIRDSTFGGCRGLTGLQLPKNLQTIEGHAFAYCSGLTGDLIIPDRVRSIGNYAFREAGFTGRLQLSQDLETIGPYCFQDCSGFTGELLLPPGLQSIGDYAFSRCWGFRGDLILPDGVTRVGKNAFFDTRFDGKLKLSAGLTEIGPYAFRFCEYLHGPVVMPKTLTTIGEGAFHECSLRDFYFMGPAPTMSPRDSPEPNASFDWYDILYARKSEPSWNWIPTHDDRYMGYELRSWYAQVVGNITLDPGCVLVHVRDATGAPLRDATVTWDGTSFKTDNRGNAQLEHASGGLKEFRVEKEGYAPFLQQNYNLRYSNLVTLYTQGEAQCRLKWAELDSPITQTLPMDLLTHTKKMGLGCKLPATQDGDFDSFHIDCQAYGENIELTYELWQNDKKIAETSTGTFLSLNVNSFQEGGGCFIRVIAADGSQLDTPIHLVFVQELAQEMTALKLMDDKASFAVGDNVPFLGGGEVTFDLPIQLPLRAFMSTDGKVMIGLNLRMVGKNNEEIIEEAKETFDALRMDVNSVNVSNLIEQQNKIDFLGDIRLDAFGYLGMDVGSNIAAGQLGLIFKMENALEINHTWIVVVVPVTAEVKADIGATLTGELQYDWSKTEVMGTWDLEPEVELEVFGGVGVGELVGAGAYGSAKLDLKLRLVGELPGLHNVDLTGEMGLKAYVGPLEYEKAFGYNTWNIYTRTGTASTASAEGQGIQMMDAGQYHPMDLTYLQEQSPWLGSSPRLQAATAQLQLQPLQEHVFRDSRPQLLAGADGLYLTFLQADPQTRVVQTMLSRYEAGAWTQPTAVGTQAVLQGDPVLFANGSDLYLAYTETNSGFDPASLLSYAQNQKLVVGRVDPQTLAFTEEQTFTGSYIRQPRFLLHQGKPTLLWVDSTVTTEEDVLFAPASSVCYSVLDGAWTQAQTLCTVNRPLMAMEPGAPQGVLTAACTLDQDGDPATSDYMLMSETAQGEAVLSQQSGRVTWGRLPGAAEETFIWNNGAALYSSDGTVVPVPGLTREYVLLGSRIYYSSPQNGTANLTTLVYENGAWSDPIQLTGDPRCLENLTMAQWQGNEWILGLSTLTEITQDHVNDDKNLVFGSVLPVSNLILESVTYDPSTMVPGSTFPVTLTVRNGGDHPVTKVDVRNANNTVLDTVNCQLQPGETIQLEIRRYCPSEETSYTFRVREPWQEEYAPADNQKTILLGMPDAVLSADYVQLDEQRYLVAIVENKGIAPASGTVRFLDEQGAVLCEADYRSVQRNETQVLTWEMDETAMDYAACNVTMELIPYGNDARVTNNQTAIFVPARPQPEAPPQSLTVTRTPEQLEVQLGTPVPDGVLVCAWYDQKGRQVAAQTQPADGKAVFPIQPAATARVYLMDADYIPLHPAEEIILN